MTPPSTCPVSTVSLTYRGRPGGKPLPKKHNTKKEPDNPDFLDFSRPRKLLFEWLTVAVIFSLVGNIVVVIVHALYARDEQWWCGQAATVG